MQAQLILESPDTYTLPKPVYKYTVMMVRDQGYEGRIPMDTKSPVSSPEVIAKLLRSYFSGLDREHFVVLLLNTKHQVIGLNTVSIGTLDTALVHPREVYKPAIVQSAAAVVLAHNHPSGDPRPSQEDINLTRKLKVAGEVLGIKVLDHIVIGEGVRYTSLLEEGLI